MHGKDLKENLVLQEPWEMKFFKKWKDQFPGGRFDKRKFLPRPKFPRTSWSVHH